MALQDSKLRTNNFNVLWLILGVFLFHAIGSIESLIIGLIKIFGGSTIYAVIYALIFNGLILLGLLYFLIWVYKNWTTERGEPFLALSLKDIKIFGLIVLVMIVVGRIISFFNFNTIPDELSIMDADDIINMQYDVEILLIINTTISFFKELILFSIFFVIIYKSRNLMSHNHQQSVMNKYNYHILKEKNLVIEILSGKFELSEYISLKQSQFENPDHDPNFDIIIDISNIEDVISGKAIKSYTENIKPIQLFTKRIKVAVITSSPSQVTGATLYKLFEERAIDCEIFSTFEYALNWLGIAEINLTDIDLNKIKN